MKQIIYLAFLSLIVTSCVLSKKITLESCPQNQIKIGNSCVNANSPLINPYANLVFGSSFFEFINSPFSINTSPMSFQSMEEDDFIFSNADYISGMMDYSFQRFFELNNRYCETRAIKQLSGNKDNIRVILKFSEEDEYQEYYYIKGNAVTYYSLHYDYGWIINGIAPRYEFIYTKDSMKLTHFRTVSDEESSVITEDSINMFDFNSKEGVFSRNPVFVGSDSGFMKLKIFDQKRVDLSSQNLTFSGHVLLVPEQQRHENFFSSNFVYDKGVIKRYNSETEQDEITYFSRIDDFSVFPLASPSVPNQYSPPEYLNQDASSLFSSSTNQSIKLFPLEEIEEVLVLRDRNFDKVIHNCLTEQNPDNPLPEWYNKKFSNSNLN